MTDMTGVSAWQGDSIPTLGDDELAPAGTPLLPDGETLDVSGTIGTGAARG